MSQRPNGIRHGSHSHISALAIAAALSAIAALTAWRPSKAAMPGTRASNAQAASTARLAVEGNMPPLEGATAWINSQPLKTADLRGESSPGRVLDLHLREAKHLRAWIEEVDCEISIANRCGLPDQLIHALFRHRAVALLIDVSAVRRAGCVSITQN